MKRMRTRIDFVGSWSLHFVPDGLALTRRRGCCCRRQVDLSSHAASCRNRPLEMTADEQEIRERRLTVIRRKGDISFQMTVYCVHSTSCSITSRFHDVRCWERFCSSRYSLLTELEQIGTLTCEVEQFVPQITNCILFLTKLLKGGILMFSCPKLTLMR